MLLCVHVAVCVCVCVQSLSISSFLEIAVSVLIFFNVLALALEHDGQTETWTHVLEYSNLVFTIVFILEMVIKLIGLGFKT